MTHHRRPYEPAILFSQMEPPPELEAEFNRWYEEEHVPDRTALTGIEAATRYRALEGTPRYLATYEIDNLSVLEQPGYRKLKEQPSDRTRKMLASVSDFTRYLAVQSFDTGEAGRHGALSVVAFAVPEHDRPEFDAWYETEHIPLLMGAADWLRVRRYRVVDHEGAAWTDLALHELRTADAMRSPERDTARSTEWRTRLAERSWFNDSGRWLYETISHQ